MSQSVVILSGMRTAIGSFGGSLAGTPPTALGARAATAALDNSGVDPEKIGHVVFGHVINTEPRDMYLARVVGMDAGVPEQAAALTVNRLCGSGAQAIVSAAQSIQLGDTEAALAGGAECMSRAPYAMPNARWGQKMGDVRTLDMMLGALNDPFGAGHMGVTAENVARDYQIPREDQDVFALSSQERAAKAQDQGHFADQIVPITVKKGRQELVFNLDEHPKATTMEGLAQLRPAFQRDGTVTAGNASGINDGAGALVLASETLAEREGLTPLARLIGYAHAGVKPDIMGTGPIPAVSRLFEKTGLAADDFDVIESNEAFASQALAVSRTLGLPDERTNPNGGAIALGHPVGATGAIITIKALHELRRTGGKRALVTMCIGGGQGIALAFERM